MKSLLSTLNKRLQSLPDDKYTIDFVKSSLKNSSPLKNFQVEINDLLSHFAWNVQIEYFTEIRDALKNNNQLETVTVTPKDNDLDESKFFVEDAIDEVLEELQKRIDDEGYESNINTVNDIHIENAVYKNWKDVLTTVTKNTLEKAIDSVFIEPSISVILNYISSSRNSNMPPSEAQLSFNNEDKSLKQALLEYKSTNQSKRKTQFLMNELHSIIHEALTISDVNQSKLILKTAIRYGYPLPISAAKIIATAMNTFLASSKIYQSGITLEIRDGAGQVTVQHQIGSGKAKLNMQHFHGSIFLCQNDYHIYAGMSNQTTEQGDDAFLYEAFVEHMIDSRSKFPKQAETLREGILKEL